MNCRIIIAIVVACSHCGCSIQAPSYTTQIAAHFVCDLRSSELLEDFDNALWLLDFSLEGHEGTAWIAEMRDNGLYVAAVDYIFDSRELRKVDHATYSGLSPRSYVALRAVFMSPPKWQEGSDFWAGPSRAFAGLGAGLSPTIVPHSEFEIGALGEWIRDPTISVNRLRPIDRIPIELTIPWLYSRYYSPFREGDNVLN